MKTVEKTVAELTAGELRRVVTTNGYQGQLQSIAVAEDPRYVELVFGDGVDGARTWVRPDTLCKVEAPA